MLRAGVAAVAAGVAAGCAAYFGGADRTLTFHAYLLFVGALGLLVAGRLAVPPRPERGRRRRRRRRSRDVPEDLARLEGQVSLASASAFDLHFRLRPLLRELAASRLARRGIDLDAEPGAAQSLLGEEAWELVRADRPEPTDRRAPGFPPARLDAVVTAIERI
jgi:hypothetical protein